MSSFNSKDQHNYEKKRLDKLERHFARMSWLGITLGIFAYIVYANEQLIRDLLPTYLWMLTTAALGICVPMSIALSLVGFLNLHTINEKKKALGIKDPDDP